MMVRLIVFFYEITCSIKNESFSKYVPTYYTYMRIMSLNKLLIYLSKYGSKSYVY